MTLLAVLSAICWAESNHTPHAINPDDGGSASYGECQIKYATAKAHGYKGGPTGLFNKETNRKIAERILRHQLKRYGNMPQAIQAYNQGYATKAPYKSNYVRKVLLKAVQYE